MSHRIARLFFFFNDTATTEIYTLSLHDALPICCSFRKLTSRTCRLMLPVWKHQSTSRSEEHTSELQSRQYLVCRLLLEKKKPNLSLPNYNDTPQQSRGHTAGPRVMAIGQLVVMC